MDRKTESSVLWYEMIDFKKECDVMCLLSLSFLLSLYFRTFGLCHQLKTEALKTIWTILFTSGHLFAELTCRLLAPPPAGSAVILPDTPVQVRPSRVDLLSLWEESKAAAPESNTSVSRTDLKFGPGGRTDANRKLMFLRSFSHETGPRFWPISAGSVRLKSRRFYNVQFSVRFWSGSMWTWKPHVAQTEKVLPEITRISVVLVLEKQTFLVLELKLVSVRTEPNPEPCLIGTKSSF